MNALCRLYLLLKQGRLPVLALFACALLLASLCLSRLSLNGSSAVFLPDTDADMRLAAELLEKSPLSGLLFVDVEAPSSEAAMNAADVLEKQMPRTAARAVRFQLSGMTPQRMLSLLPSFFSPEVEAALTAALEESHLQERLHEAKKTLQELGGAAAIPWIRGDPLRFRDVLTSRLPVSSSLSFLSRPVSEDGRHVLLIFRPTGGVLDTSGARIMLQAVQEARHLLKEGVTLRLSGGPRYTAANAEAIEHDIGRIALLSLAGLGFAYLVLVRSRGAFWIFLTPVAATLLAAALTGCVWPAASGLVLGFGMALMGLAEDYAIHMHFALRSTRDKQRAYEDVCPPLAQGFLLNLSGFAVLLLSSIPAIRQMAFFSIASLTAGFLLAVLILPFLPGFSTPERLAAPIVRKGGRQAALARGLAVCAALLGVCFLLFEGMRADFSPQALSAGAQTIARDAAALRSLWKLDSGINVLFTADSCEEVLRMGSRCAGILREKDWQDVRTPSDFLLPEKESADNCARWKRWLGQNAPLLRTRLARAASLEHFREDAFRPFFEALEQSVSPLNLDSPILQELGLRDVLAMTLFERGRTHCLLLSCTAPTAAENTEAALAAALPQEDRAHAFVFSPRLLETDISVCFRQERNLLLPAALLALMLLVLFLRRPARVLAACTPPLLSLAAVLAALRLAGLPLNLASLSALPIVVGLALDHGVMVTHALEFGQNLGTRRAVVLSSLTAFMSMGLLAFSEHPALRSMGCVIFSGLTAELTAALWLIPLLYPHSRPKA